MTLVSYLPAQEGSDAHHERHTPYDQDHEADPTGCPLVDVVNVRHRPIPKTLDFSERRVGQPELKTVCQGSTDRERSRKVRRRMSKYLDHSRSVQSLRN